MEYAALAAEEGVLLLDGVPPGTYTVAAFANIARQRFPALVIGESTPEDLQAVFPGGTSQPTSDPVLHHAGRYEVRRGAIRVRTMPLDKLYYRIELTVSGAERIDGFGIRFDGAPSGCDYAGDMLYDSVAYIPRLNREGELLKGAFFIPRFGRSGRVMMTLRAGDLELAAMPLSDYLLQNDILIDLDARDVVIPITVRVGETSATVIVDDWNAGAVELPIVGH